MPLGDDQKAMLRLLAREQSYEDIAALMGLSVDEVVTRAKGAVEQLEAEGIPAPALPDAPDGSTAKAPEPKAERPPEPAPPAPAPKQPEVAPSPSPGPAAARTAAPRKPRDKNVVLAIGAGVVAVIVIVVLAVLLISNSGGDTEPKTGKVPAGDSTLAENGSGTRQPTTAQLEAVDGSGASGAAEFGRVKNSLALGIKAQGVDPAPQGSIYMVWLADTPQKMLPLTALTARKTGRINASYQVPTEAVVYLASGEFDRMVITLCDNAELRKALEQANKDKKFPTYTGDPVLEGQIVGPIVGAAERLEARQKERKEEAE